MNFKEKLIQTKNRFTKVKSAFNEFLSISSTKKSRIIASVLAIILHIFLTFYVALQEMSTYLTNRYMFVFTVLAPVFLWFIVAYKLECKKQWLNKIVQFFFMLIASLAIAVSSEILNDIFINGFTFIRIFGAFVIALVLNFIVFTLSGSVRVSVILSSTVITALSLANSYLVKFRGSPLLPTDFFAMSTAQNVAAGYDYTPDQKMITAVLILLLVIAAAIRLQKLKSGLVFKISSRVVTGIVSVTVAVVFFATNFVVNMGIIPDYWDPNYSNQKYGFLLNYLTNAKYMTVDEPDGYDADYIGKITDDLAADVQNNSSGKTPNIICIMNEALADLSVLGDFETNEDYMPFMRSLTENTVKGNLYTSILGGGTANTEFEFLTGYTTAFLPAGSYPYVIYLDEKTPSLATTLKSLNYSATSFHPYYASGWNRPVAYKNLGFDKFISLEDMFDDTFLDYLKWYGYSVQLVGQSNDEYFADDVNRFIRRFVSDSYDFNFIIDDYEKRDTSKPYFMFNVTMQNHGGYDKTDDNLGDDIYVTSLSANYEKTNEYLTLLKQTDLAFEELINHFSKVDEPTVICMFGDHQPAIEAEFVAEVMGVESVNSLSLEQTQKRYITPFYIWANYDIEEQYVEKLSANYLSSLVLKTAGVELTPYNEYLLALSEKLPVIDCIGYIDDKGNHYHKGQKTPYDALLKDYAKVQYNGLFDRKNTDKSVFYIK